MKIVHIITRMILGGAQENTLLTCEGLHRRGHDVTLVTGPTFGPEGQLIDRAQKGGYRVIEVDSLRREIHPFYDFTAYRSLKKIIRELAPDIVHTHSAKAGVLGRWAARAVRDTNEGGCCGAVREFQKAQAAAELRPKIVHTVHGLSFHPYQASWLNKLYVAVERKAAQRTDAFISVADAMTRQSLAEGIGRTDQYSRVFSGMDTQGFLAQRSPEQVAALRAELGVPADAVVITTVARLAELKGHESIIAAAHEIAPRCENVYWLFVGDGHLRGQVERQIAAAGVMDRFRLTGLVSPERVGELLHASDILVHCSLREGLARALPQALLCGKPVISYDLDGAGEVVVEGQTGLLIAPDDIEALVAAQEKLIADPNLRAQMGQTGREFCAREFSCEVMVDRIEKVYDSLVGKQKG